MLLVYTPTCIGGYGVSYRLCIAVMSICALATTPASAVIRGKSYLSSCIITWGDFCPIESIGLSLVGTAFATAVVFAVRFGFRALLSGGAPHKPVVNELLSKEADLNAAHDIALAKERVARGDYLGAFELLDPLVQKKMSPLSSFT